MADRKSLGIIGWIMGAVTLAVMTAGLIVVQGNLDGRFSLENASRPVVSAALPTVLR